MQLSPIINGTLREHYILLFSSAGAIALVAGFVGAWVGARLAARTALAELKAAERPGVSPEHLRMLHATVESIGLEVERVAESQRFLTKLMSERHDVPLLPPGRLRRDPNVITPH